MLELFLVISLKTKFYHNVELKKIGDYTEEKCLTRGQQLAKELKLADPDIEVKVICLP